MVDGLVFAKTEISFVILIPALPSESYLTVIWPSWLGEIGSLGKSATAQPQLAVTEDIIKSCLPVFLNLKLHVTTSPEVNFPKSIKSLSNYIEVEFSIKSAETIFSFLLQEKKVTESTNTAIIIK